MDCYSVVEILPESLNAARDASDGSGA